MKMNLKFLTVATALACLTGCIELKGILTAKEVIVFKDVDGEPAEYVATKHEATVSFDRENNLILDFGSNFWGTKKNIFNNTKYNLNEIHNGEKLYLTAAESGQNYDVEAQYTESTKYLSGILTITEDCTKMVKGEFAPGKQTIKIRKMSRTIGIEASLISPESKKAVARFSGSETKLDRDYIPSAGDDCK